MPRPPRTLIPGALYHVTARGIDRGPIVRGSDDRDDFFAVVGGVMPSFGWQCHAYCLMDNHFHLLVQTPEPNLSAGMQRLSGTYAQRFNQRYKRSGHLFQGRFHSTLIDQQSQLLETCRYVVLNPVRAGLCPRPVDWPWSSYRATAGFTTRPPFLALSAIHSLFSRDTSRAIRAYRAFVDEAIATE